MPNSTLPPTVPQPVDTLPVVKGSWEDLLIQAQQMAARQDDAALPTFEKLFDRLSALPPRQRQAGEGRLQEILERAAQDYQYYLTSRDQYEEAIQVNQRMQSLLPDPQRKDLILHEAALLIQSGKVDDGLAVMRRCAENGAVWDWGTLALASLEAGRVDSAGAAIATAEQALKQQDHGDLSTPNARIHQAYVAYLKARLAIARGDFPGSVAWFEYASTLHHEYADNPQMLYTPLVYAGAYAEALSLIRRDVTSPVRSGFWQGLCQYRLGKQSEAEYAWRKVTKVELPEDGDADYLELVFTHYYLGDPAGFALATVLEAMRGQPGFWGHFYLAGIGWAQRGDLAAARSDMQIAQMRRKSMAEGRKLGADLWQFCTDLLDETQQTAIVEFFENAQIQRRA